MDQKSNPTKIQKKFFFKKETMDQIKNLKRNYKEVKNE